MFVIMLILLAIVSKCSSQFFLSDDDDSEESDSNENSDDSLFPVPKMISNFGSNLFGNMFSSGDKKPPNRRESIVQTTTTEEPNRDGRLISSSAFNKISETLGALNTVGRLIVNMTRGQSVSLTNNNVKPSDSVPNAILTLTSNVLGQNLTKKIEPFIKREPVVTQQLQPVQQKPTYSIANYHDEDVEETTTKKAKRKNPKKQTSQSKIDQVPSENALFDPSLYLSPNETKATADADVQGKEGEHRCTTPAGKPGRCEDLSNCPGLLLNLSHLRESLCFKSLFVPGVCCPLDELSEDPVTQRPQKLTTAPPHRTTTRQTLILKPTSRRPLVPVQTISNENQSPSQSLVQSGFENFVDPEDCGQQEVNSGRIVGGKKAQSGEWPWMAAIFLHGSKRTEFWCGGSLIGKKYILTAAHCTRDSRQRPFAANQFTVRLGDIDLLSDKEDSAPITIKVKEVRAHPSFSRVGFYNDIAILVLEENVRKNKYVIPLCLPQPTLKKARLPGRRATVVGWGTTYYGGKESNVQRQALLPIWRNEDCNRAYFQPITDNFLCAGYSEGGVDACQGDSGGPLMMEIDGRWTQLGIVSFGNKCGEPSYPGVYTRVSEYMDWIRENTRN
ncbi:proclotting enzyme [Culicoides brevitarsis]|uniref:proclotting enzyme n=1 Tax=Culicoides brevitarsis TaxID=469753 RepID=UPI00307B4B26